jgi:hypothetical protein
MLNIQSINYTLANKIKTHLSYTAQEDSQNKVKLIYTATDRKKKESGLLRLFSLSFGFLRFCFFLS